MFLFLPFGVAELLIVAAKVRIKKQKYKVFRFFVCLLKKEGGKVFNYTSLGGFRLKICVLITRQRG